MVKKPTAPIEPSRREILGGLAILLVIGGVALSRGGSPQSTWARHQGASDQSPNPSMTDTKATAQLNAVAPKPVAKLNKELAAKDQTATND